MRNKVFMSILSAAMAVLLLACGFGLSARAAGVTALPGGTVGIAYRQQAVSAPGAKLTLSGTLPEGLSLSSAGVLSGTPEKAGEYAFSVNVQAGGYTETLSYSLSVAAFSFLTKALPDVTANTDYSGQLRLSTDAKATFSLAEGTLPAGLSLDSATGAITGQCTGLSDTLKLVFKATVGSNSVQQTLTLHPAAAAVKVTTEDTLPAMVVTGESHALTLLLTGGSGEYTVSVSGDGKNGISTTVSGSQVDLAAAWSQAGGVNAVIKVTDRNNTQQSAEYTLKTTVVAPLSAGLFAETPQATEDSAIAWQMTASGGSGSYTYTLVDGTLPDGVFLSSSGAFTGSGKAGAFTVTVKITDTVYPTLSAYGTAECVIYGKPLLSPSVWPRGTTQLTVTVEGGLSPYTLTVVDASTDTALSSAKTAATDKANEFLVTVPEDAVGALSLLCTDALLQETGITYTVDARKELTFTCGEVPQGTAGTAYDATLSLTHNMTEDVYFIIEGLPEGLTADDAGHITGTPKASGSYALAITGTCEALNTSSTINATLVINSTSSVTITPVSGLASAQASSGDALVYQMIPHTGASEAKFTVTTADSSAKLSWNGTVFQSGDTLTQAVGDNKTASGTLTVVLGDDTVTRTLIFAIPGESIQVNGLPGTVYEETPFSLTAVGTPTQAYLTSVEWEYDTANITHTGSNPATFTAKTSGTYTVKATVKDAYGKELTAAVQFRVNVAVAETTAVPATKRPSVTVRITTRPTATPVPTPTPKPGVTLIPEASENPGDESTDPDLDLNGSPSPSLSPEETPSSSMTPDPDTTQTPQESEKKGAPLWLWPLLVALAILIPSVIYLIVRSIRLRNQPIVEQNDEFKVVDAFELPPEDTNTEKPDDAQPKDGDDSQESPFDDTKR